MSNKSKLTLLIDGNWLLMSRLAVLNGKYANDDEMCRDLQLMLIKSINVVLRTFPSIDNIIFVSDGGSWRNDLPIPSFLSEKYKGTRELNPDINMTMVFSYFEEFINTLDKFNITTSKAPNIEGDDWIWYWSTKLNKEGTNVIIWSCDKDLTQLVKTNFDTGVFTVCWNIKAGVTLQDGDYSENSELDFFFKDLNKETNDKYLHEIIKKASKINKITPSDIVIDKIIRGDKGDNILPIIMKPSSTNTDKLFRVTTKDINFALNIHDISAVKEYISNIFDKYKNNVVKRVNEANIPKTQTEVLEHFIYNTKLVSLEQSVYPTEILETMNKQDTYNTNKNITDVNNFLLAKTNNLANVLDII